MWHLVPALFRGSTNKLKKKKKLSQRKGSDVAALSSSLKTGNAMFQWWVVSHGGVSGGTNRMPAFLCDWLWSTYIHMNSVGRADLTVARSRRDRP